jgi:CheY-like chemotaxis protein
MARQLESPMQQHPLRILVVEDNMLIAETIVDMVESCGCAVVGPAPNLERGLSLLERETVDGALLDVNLSGTFSFPLAAVLTERGVPFVFLTGYDDGTIFPVAFRGVRRVNKPFDQEDVARVVRGWGRSA